MQKEASLPDFAANIVGEPDADPKNIPESVIQDVWRRQRFRALDLQTTQGSSLLVSEPGKLNTNQGPDFVGARITLDGVTWCGAVEIHRCSADWYRHGHETDPIYNNVILHATLIADRETGRLRRQDGSLLPEIVLLPRLDTPLRRLSWDHKLSVHQRFPCEKQWPTVPADIVDPFLIDLAGLRMRQKSARIGKRFGEAPDLDQILFEETCRALGFMPNAESMVLLARRVPFRLASELESQFDLMCLLLGTSGLLPGAREFVTSHRSSVEYVLNLTDRYHNLNRDLKLTSLPRQTWRLSRMRPGNSPTLRIAQAASLFGKGGPLSKDPADAVIRAVEAPHTRSTLTDLLTAEPDEYWQYHSNLTNGRRDYRSAQIGADRCTSVAVNAFLPLAFFSSELQGRPELGIAVMQCLREFPAQTDTVTRPYTRSRGRAASSLITQGIHRLSKSWCGKSRCLECPIGRHLSRTGSRFVG